MRLRVRKLFKGFISRIFWSATLLVVSLGALLTSVTIYQQSRFLKQDIKKRGEYIIGELQYAYARGIRITPGDAASVQILSRILDSVQGDILYLSVGDADGKMIDFRQKPSIGPSSMDDDLLRKALSERRSYWRELTVNGHHVMEVTAPIILLHRDSFKNGGRHQKVAAVIRAGFSLSEINRKTSRIIWSSIIITLLFSPGGAVLTYLLARRITEPLEQLKEGVESIERGDMYEQIEVRSKDEIGDLAASFNRMVDVLKIKDEEIMLHMQKLSALNLVASSVNQSLDLDSTLHSSMREVLKVTGMEAGWIYLPSEQDGTLSIAAYEGVDNNFVCKVDLLRHGEGIAGRVAIEGRSIIEDDISFDPRITREAIFQEGFKGFASIPLRYQEKTVGVMNITSFHEHLFTKEEIELLHSIGDQIGTAIENASLYKSLVEQLAKTESTHGQLIKAARLASIGELSANVAHEINNPLTGILTHASIMMDEMPDDDPDKSRLKIIYDETIRIRHIVRGLLDFSRQREPRRTSVHIVDVIRDVLNLTSHLAKAANVTIVEDYQRDNPLISVDIGQMKQVLLNLFNNSLFAMPNGGELRVRVTYENNFVVMEISDTGTGIPDDVINRIFDPFFTTKPETKGTGLGLSISHGIIDRHGGDIRVSSSPGKGTLFVLRLPVGEDIQGHGSGEAGNL